MRALVSFFAITVALSTYAQNNDTFLSVIKGYEEQSDITFSYDAELIGLVNSEVTFSTRNLEQFIKEVESAFPFAIEKIDETYYTISAIESTYHLTVLDSIDSSVLTEEFDVTVIVNDAPQTTVFSEGKWQFTYKPEVEDNIQIFSQGYKNARLAVGDLVSRKELVVGLGLPTTRLNTVVVEDYLTRGLNMLPSKQQIQIDLDDLPLLPGETDGDIFASIAALPGISNPDGRAGNLLIRGSETDQSLILFDNIPIYHRGHYYGTISPYNPKLVSDVEVFRSGFHPKYGDRVGGAIVINSDEVDHQSVYGIGANTLFGMGYGKVRFNNKWSGSFGIRNSYSRKFESPKLTAISESVFSATALDGPNGLTEKVNVIFRDYNGKFNFQPDKKNSFTFSGIYTYSQIDFSPPPAPQRPRSRNDNRFDNVGGNVGWNLKLGNGWASEFNTTYSRYKYDFTVEGMSPDGIPFFSNNQIKDFNVVQEFSLEGEMSRAQYGLDYKWQEVSIEYRNMLRDSTIYFLENVESSHTISPFANYEFLGWDRWYFQLGVRGTYYSNMEDYSVSPRILANYDVSKAVTLKGSYGWYNQFVSQVKNLEFTNGGFDNELWTLADGESGFIIRGTQAMAGMIASVNDWILDVELFHKTADDITVYEDRRLDPRWGYFSMDMVAYGTDILLKKQVSEATSLWVGYSYHDSKIMLDTTENATYKSKFVQPHIYYLGGAFKKNRWKVSLGYRYASGLNAQSLDIAYAEAIFLRGPQNPPPPPPPGSPPPPRPPNPFEGVPERYPNVHSLDISASYMIPRTDQRNWSASFGVSLLNTLGQPNLTDRVYRSRNGFVDREAIGFAPNLMVIVEW